MRSLRVTTGVVRLQKKELMSLYYRDRTGYRLLRQTLKGFQKNGGTPPGYGPRGALLSGGLRYAATTGYYLTALQAEIRSLRFPHRLYLVVVLMTSWDRTDRDAAEQTASAPPVTIACH